MPRAARRKAQTETSRSRNGYGGIAIAFGAQIIAAYSGDFLRKRAHSFKQGERHDFNIVPAATLTLVALIVGFSFSMAVGRYDQRKTLEEAEAQHRQHRPVSRSDLEP